MAALAIDFTWESRDRGRSSYLIDDAAGVTVFAGSLVGVDPSDGFLIPWANDATFNFLGVALVGQVSTVGASPASEVRVQEGGVIIRGVSVTASVQASVGSEVFCTTDNMNVMALTAASRAVGRIVAFRSASDLDVELYTPAEFLANA